MKQKLLTRWNIGILAIISGYFLLIGMVFGQEPSRQTLMKDTAGNILNATNLNLPPTVVTNTFTVKNGDSGNTVFASDATGTNYLWGNTFVTNLFVTNKLDIVWGGTNYISFMPNTKKLSLWNNKLDESNYEEGFLKWETNTLKLGTIGAGTGSYRRIIIGNPHPTNTAFIELGPDSFSIGTNRTYFDYPFKVTSLGGEPTVKIGGNYPVLDIGHNGGNITVNGQLVLTLSAPTLYAGGVGNYSVFVTHRGINNCNGSVVFGNPSLGIITNAVKVGGLTNIFYVATHNTNTSMVFTNLICDVINRTNWLGGNTTITNLVSVSVNGQPGKSITNTWYSVSSDGATVVTNTQVFINGILTSWKVNGVEL